MGRKRIGAFLACGMAALPLVAPARSDPAIPDLTQVVSIEENYGVIADLVYDPRHAEQDRLDIYVHRGDRPRPTLVYFHGGGWQPGYSKNRFGIAFLPFLEMGWNVVNVDYRDGGAAPAPAAVEDCVCAMRWIARHAAQYRIDPDRLVLSGHSAGAHLALMSGLAPSDAGFDRDCPGQPAPKAAAIVNWFGIADVAALLDGPERQTYAVNWVHAGADAERIARRVSPLAYVRPGAPPVITIHGDKDPAVPYGQALRLQDALERAGVPNRLVTIPGGNHGGFGLDATRSAYETVFAFLAANGLPIRP